jgi:hypothetical protein
MFVALVASAQDPGDRTIDTHSDADFGSAAAEPALREFLQTRGIHRRQRFCIAGYQASPAGDGDKRTRIHWSEGHQIILWRGGDIAQSRRVIDLRKDLVPTEPDLDGRTYLVTREWANRLIADCEQHGAKYHIGSSRK